MGMTRYVQHKSGIGEKWKLLNNLWNNGEIEPPAIPPNTWEAENVNQLRPLMLPKSEYVLCEPPAERWKNVTADCQVNAADNVIYHITHQGQRATRFDLCDSGYRIRKVQLAEGCLSTRQCWAFLVEKREP